MSSDPLKRPLGPGDPLKRPLGPGDPLKRPLGPGDPLKRPLGPGDRAASVLDGLRSSGVRITAPRRAVVTALVHADDHVTADELAARVAEAEPDVHLSTVYRTLDALEKLGVVTHVHLGHGRAVYHLTDRMHQHAVCEGCGAVVELADDVLGDVQRRVRRETGFEVDPHHFALVGRCKRCAG